VSELLFYLEEYIKQNGRTKIAELARRFGVGRSIIRKYIRTSTILDISGPYAILRRTVSSEYGEVTPDDLITLRKYDVPTPEEIECRKQAILDCIDDSLRTPFILERQDEFTNLIQAVIEFFTSLTDERASSLAVQLRSDLCEEKDERKLHKIYIYIYSRQSRSIKGWAAFIVNRNSVVHAMSGCMFRVSVLHVYLNILARILRFVKPFSAIQIVSDKRSIDTLRRSFNTDHRMSLSERYARKKLLSLLSSYTISFGIANDEIFQNCRNMAIKARDDLCLLGVGNGRVPCVS
jgi:hypothetical protein